MKRVKRTEVKPAGEEHQVVTLVGGKPGLYRRAPCGGCPWRKDNTGKFPAEAFKHSANTAYDGSTSTFSCHESGAEKPTDCAGFLLRNAENNIAVRIKAMSGLLDMSQVSDGGHDLHESYRSMAVANGVDPKDPVLKRCRADDEGRK